MHKIIDVTRRQHHIQWLLVVLLLALLGGALAYLVLNERQQLLQREGKRLLDQARVVDENIGRQLVGARAALDSVRNDMPYFAADGLREGASRQLKALSAAMPGVRTMLVVDANGTIAASNRAELLDQNVGERPYFRDAKRNPQLDTLYVSEPFTIRLKIFSLSLVKILNDTQGNFDGVVAATLEPEYFAVMLRSVLYAPDMRAALAHGDGKVLMVMPPHPASAGKNLAVPGSMFSRHRDSGQAESLMTGIVHSTGEERMMAVRTIAPQGVGMDKPLVLAVSREMGALLAPWRSTALLYGQMYGLLALLLLVSVYLLQRKQMVLLALSRAREKETAEHAQRMDLALAGADLGLWDLDLVTGKREVNARAQEMIGLTADQVVDDVVGWRAWVHPDDLPALRTARSDHQAGRTEAFVIDFRIRHRDGHWVWIHCRGKVTQRDATGRALRMTGTYLDVTEQKQAQAQIRELAFLDPLTQLPNRRLLMDRLGQARLASARSRMFGVVMLLDLDDFKWVNDNLGHDMGDLLLQQLASRLLTCVRGSDTVARIGGDEFVVLIQNLGVSRTEAQNQAHGLAAKIEAALRLPYVLVEHQHTLSASVGFALFSGEDQPVDSLLREADQAMYAAKRIRQGARLAPESLQET
jgi:diguanylate cyclase (GGDEF)-like protein/PAS domain S-box-containing protein